MTMRLDALGLKCPLPVLRTQKILADMLPGQQIEVEASDPMSRLDIPHFCREAGHALLAQSETQDSKGRPIYIFKIERGGL
jgi:tRNA 2-thiouridine synthesizing protein A